MKKIISGIIIIVVLLLIAWGISKTAGRQEEAPLLSPSVMSNETDVAIRSLVTAFGTQLKNVSLLAPRSTVVASLDQNYSAYLTKELLTIWKTDSSKALGRSVSSPWPDRIEIAAITPKSNGSYIVEGNVIEVTSATTSPAAVYPVTLTVQNTENGWRIAGVDKGSYSELPQQISLNGKRECLPHMNTNGPQTLECAFGILASNGKHYALDLSAYSHPAGEFITNSTIHVEGLLVPKNQLNSNMWQKYNIEGIIRVTYMEER